MNVTLHLTTGCNLQCAYCFEGAHERRQDMTPEVLRQAIDFALQADRTPGIVFFGGEPLLRPDLVRDAVAYAKARAAQLGAMPHFKLTTNGTLLSDDVLEFVAREDVAVSLSIDGTRQAHDTHRRYGRGGTFDLVEARARALLAVRPYSPAIMVATPETAPFAAAGVRHLFELGFRYVVFDLDYSSPWTDESFAVLAAQYREMAALYLELTRAERKFYLSVLDEAIATRVQGGSPSLKCRTGIRQVSVAVDGSLHPCVQYVPSARGAGRFPIGDVWKGVDEDARRRRYEQTREPAAECLECALHARCNAHCGCLNLQVSGTPGVPPPILCAHERLRLPLADEVAEALWRERAPMFVQKHYNPAFALLSLVEDRGG